VQWDQQAQMRLSDKQHVSFGATELPTFMVDLEVSHADASGLTIRVVSNVTTLEYRLAIAETLTGGYQHTPSLRAASAFPERTGRRHAE
jgi:hypothetical protein